MHIVVSVSLLACMLRRPPDWKLCADLVPANSSPRKKKGSGMYDSVRLGAKSMSLRGTLTGVQSPMQMLMLPSPYALALSMTAPYSQLPAHASL